MRLLHIIPTLQWGSAERQLRILLRELPAVPFHQQVIVLRGDVPAELRCGHRVTALRLPSRLDFASLFKLRRFIQDATPDVLHAWRLEACRWVAAGARVLPMRRIASIWRWPGPSYRGAWLRRALDYAALTPMSARLVPRWAESDPRFASSQLTRCQFTSVGYGVAADEPADVRRQRRREIGNRLEIPSDVPLVGFVGPWLRENRVKDAIWAGDLLKVVRDDVHVLIAGYGPMAGRLQTFRRQVQIEDRVHFVSHPELMETALDALDCVWITGQTASGMPTLLEAMSRGIPVIATDLPCHRRYVCDGRTGMIVNLGHRAGFARQTLRLLDEPQFARQLATAAQSSVTRSCAISRVVDEYAQLYGRYGG